MIEANAAAVTGAYDHGFAAAVAALRDQAAESLATGNMTLYAVYVAAADYLTTHTAGRRPLTPADHDAIDATNQRTAELYAALDRNEVTGDN